MAKVINANHPDAGVTQYDGNRADEMAKVAHQQYLDAVDDIHRAVYAMEMFNIYMEQLMHKGLNVYDGGSVCSLNDRKYWGPWYYDPSRPNTVRLSTQGGEGEDVSIDTLKTFGAHWVLEVNGSYGQIDLFFEDGRLSVGENFYDNPEFAGPSEFGSGDPDMEMFHDGTFSPERVSLLL